MPQLHDGLSQTRSLPWPEVMTSPGFLIRVGQAPRACARSKIEKVLHEKIQTPPRRTGYLYHADGIGSEPCETSTTSTPHGQRVPMREILLERFEFQDNLCVGSETFTYKKRRTAPERFWDQVVVANTAGAVGWTSEILDRPWQYEHTRHIQLDEEQQHN